MVVYHQNKEEITSNIINSYFFLNRNAISALIRITHEEGFKTLFAGLSSTVVRSMVHNAAQLGMYSQSKQFFWKKLKLFKQYIFLI